MKNPRTKGDRIAILIDELIALRIRQMNPDDRVLKKLVVCKLLTLGDEINALRDE